MSIYKDKKVLITGASTGIGYALAEELNKRGAEVILTARSEDKLHALAEKIKASGGKAHVFVEDLSIQGSAEALYNQIKSQNLSVDILNQIKAVRKSIASVEGKILKTHLEECVKDSLKGEKEFERKVEEIIKVLKR